MSDDRDPVAYADEPGAPALMHHGLIRLECSERAELQLQELRARDRVQPERVHARNVRQDVRSSFSAPMVQWCAEDGRGL